MKPNCNCNEELIKKIKEKNNLNGEAFIYFRDLNIFNGALTNAIIIEEKVTTKAGKQRNKSSHVNIVHNYCPFCGVAYQADSQKL